MFFLALSRYLDEKDIYTFFPQFLYILLEPLQALTFINVSLITITFIYLFKVKKEKTNYKTLIIVYFLCILNTYIKSKIPGYIFALALALIGSFLVKKHRLSFLIIPQLILAYIIIRITNNPYIIGILFSIFKFKSNYEHEVGINIWLLLFTLFYCKYELNLLVNLLDNKINKFNIYLLVIIIGFSYFNRVANKHKM